MGIFERLGLHKKAIPKMEESAIATTLAERRTTREDEQRAYHHQRHMEDLAGGGDNADNEQRTTVRGESYFFWGPAIADLKREGRLDEALKLSMECTAAAERDALWLTPGDPLAAPAPGWTDDCCIIARKMGNFELEIALIRRWASHVPVEFREQALERSGFAKRLAKAQLMLGKATVTGDVVTDNRQLE